MANTVCSRHYFNRTTLFCRLDETRSAEITDLRGCSGDNSQTIKLTTTSDGDTQPAVKCDYGELPEDPDFEDRNIRDSAENRIKPENTSNSKDVNIRRQKVGTLQRSTSYGSGLNDLATLYRSHKRTRRIQHGNVWARLSGKCAMIDSTEIEPASILATGIVGTVMVDMDERRTKTDPNTYASPLSERMMRLDLLKLSRSDKDWRTLTGIRPKDPIEELITERLIQMERLQASILYTNTIFV